ncbi:MAG: hypothetical protein ICV83_21380 [Cytophagales bacterium]|nr:hypothetical protein [Cytophagales bacterium]
MAAVEEGNEDKVYKESLFTAFLYYGAPNLFIAIFLVDMILLSHKTGMFFWCLFLMIELPCSAIGSWFTVRAVKQQQTNTLKRELVIGLAIFLGVIGCIGGVMGYGLLFMISA